MANASANKARCFDYPFLGWAKAGQLRAPRHGDRRCKFLGRSSRRSAPKKCLNKKDFPVLTRRFRPIGELGERQPNLVCLSGGGGDAGDRSGLRSTTGLTRGNGTVS